MSSRNIKKANAMPVTAVNILNNNDFVQPDGYDGIRYTFAPGKAITIPVDAAQIE